MRTKHATTTNAICSAKTQKCKSLLIKQADFICKLGQFPLNVMVKKLILPCLVSLINNNNDKAFFLPFPRYMNVSEAHVVVVAKDSGIPPRETSVPVVVHFPNHRASELKAKEDEAFTLMVVFGLVLSFAFIVIVFLAGYIW